MSKYLKFSVLVASLFLLVSLSYPAQAYDKSDLTSLITSWLKSVSNSTADTNADGKINTRDLGIMMSNWGYSGPPPAPEICGNGNCVSTENCTSCSRDCGVCPNPTNSVTVRARGNQGDETIDLRVNSTTVKTWTLSNSFQNYSVTANVSDSDIVTVNFTNDNSGVRDVWIDYAIINGTTKQAEDQAINTAFWNENTWSCGGSYSEQMGCNGYIQFQGNAPAPAPAPTPTPSNNITFRALGLVGDETIDLEVNNSTIKTWTLTTAYQDYSTSATVSVSDSVTVNFTNDDGNRDVQIDYAIINGNTYQAENQATNTGAWNNNTGSCGGTQGEWINCNGYIEFKVGTPNPAPSPTPTPTPAPTPIPTPTPTPSPSGWTLNWSDEFDYNGLPDPNKWGYETGFRPQWSDVSKNGYRTWYADARWENSRVENGNLVIEARADGFNGYDISTACVSSRQTKQFMNGKLEIRAKMNTAVNAVDSALWLVGTASSNWPDEGEIDLIEYTPVSGAFAGGVDYGLTTFHTIYSHSPGVPSVKTYIPNITSQYHTWTMEWNQSTIIVYVDGREVTRKNNVNGQTDWPFWAPMFLYMNIEPSGYMEGVPYDWAGSPNFNLNLNDFPITYYVDYVRYYTWN